MDRRLLKRNYNEALAMRFLRNPLFFAFFVFFVCSLSSKVCGGNSYGR